MLHASSAGRPLPTVLRRLSCARTPLHANRFVGLSWRMVKHCQAFCILPSSTLLICFIDACCMQERLILPPAISRTPLHTRRDIGCSWHMYTTQAAPGKLPGKARACMDWAAIFLGTSRMARMSSQLFHNLATHQLPCPLVDTFVVVPESIEHCPPGAPSKCTSRVIPSCLPCSSNLYMVSSAADKASGGFRVDLG